MPLTGYYQQLHFKLNDLELFYNMPVVINPETTMAKCHHVENLICSKAKEFTPEYCIKERKCELYMEKDKLFRELGIHGPTLKNIDKKLREN